MATTKNLVIDQGANFSANIQFLDYYKRPISLVGYDVRSKLRTSYDAANAASFTTVITNAAQGNVSISFTAGQTATLKYGRYVYDIEAYQGNSAIRIVEGAVTVTPRVSGADLGSLLTRQITTTDLPEGNQLYYTNARVASALSGFSGNIIPSQSNTYNLGSPDRRWKSLFLEEKTIYLGNVAISLDDLTNKLTFIDTNNAAAQINLQIGSGANAVLLGAQDGTLSTFLAANSVTANMIADGAVTPSKLGGFNTANIVEFGSLYFTNARAIAAFTAGPNVSIDANGVISIIGSFGGGGGGTNYSDLTTANVLEIGSNLYFTNARAIAAFSAGANISISPTGIISLIGSGAGGGIGYSDLTTANVIEFASNLYFTNARVYANIGPLLNTGNIIEHASNLYFTTSRSRFSISEGLGVSYSPITGLVAIGQNVSPNASVTFANLVVTGTTNFYGNVTTHSSNNLSISDNMIYLNAQSDSSNPDLGIAANYNDGSYKHAGFFRDATDGIWKVFDNYIPEPDANIFINTAHASFRLANLAATTYTGNVVGNVTGYVSTISNFTTNNLIEGSNNLYYTNARVYANVIGPLNLKANLNQLNTGNVIEFANNLYFTNTRVYANIGPLLNTGNIIEHASNLYFTNTRVYANVIGLLNLKANLNQLNTGNVIEFANNLYFTNARVSSLFTAGPNAIIYPVLGGITGTEVIGMIIDGKMPETTANVRESSSNLYFTNARAIGAFTAGANIVISPSGVISLVGTGGGSGGTNYSDLTTANVVEIASNLYFTNTRVYANIGPLLNTGNVIEFASNLYFTNTRVYANISPLMNTGNIVEHASNLYFTNTRVYANIGPLLNTGNVIEFASNLYFTNTRVYANVIGLLNLKANLNQLNTGNVIEFASNLYFTNTRVYANIIPLLNLKSNIVDFTTANTIELPSNLYFTNTRVYANIGPLLNTGNVIEFASNLYYTNARVYANVIGLLNDKANLNQLNTGNVIEFANNLYFTNVRVYANVIPLFNLKANVIDLTTANVSESASNLYYTNSRVYANVITLLNGKANLNQLNTGNVIEFANNLYFTNVRVYANVIGLLNAKANLNQLNTGNVIEFANNLYFTNLRVLANVVPYVAGVLATKANVVDLSTANVRESASNLYYTNTRVYANIAPLLFNYATVANLNLRATTSQLTTANVIEFGNNIYYSNARVAANTTVLLPFYRGNVAAGNVIVGTGIGGSVIGANLIQANNIIVGTITISSLAAFRVYGINGAAIVSSGTTLAGIHSVLDYNQTSSYNASTGIFTAPISGLYNVFLNVRVSSQNIPARIGISRNNGDNVCMWEVLTNNAGAQLFGVSTISRLTAGDTLRAKVITGSITFDANCNWGAAFNG
jgi:hypothetical protein